MGLNLFLGKLSLYKYYVFFLRLRVAYKFQDAAEDCMF